MRGGGAYAVAARRVVAMLAAVTLGAVGVVAASAGPALAAGTGSISGTVTAAAGGAPLSGICVGAFVHSADPPQVLVETATAADGTYTLSSVPDGNVDVRFTSSGLCPGGVASNLVTQWWADQPTELTATVVVVASNAIASINAAMVAGGSIAGTVTAANGGAPLAGICVAALIPGVDELLVASAATGADGSYSVTGVPAGNLHVEFFSSGFCPGGAPSSFVTQWYNGQPTASTADLVGVTAGATTGGINAALDASGSISGTVTAALGGAPLSGICVAVYAPYQVGVVPQLLTSSSTAADGTYTVDGAPVGSVDVKFFSTGFCPGGHSSNYVMQWYNGKAIQADADPVSVAAGATTPNVNAALVAGGSIAGTVTAAGGGAGLSGICVAAFSTGANPAIVASTGTDVGGGYKLDGVAVGDVRVRFDSQGFCPGGAVADYVTQWFNHKASFATADNVTVTVGATTPNIDAALVAPTAFTITVNGAASATVEHGTSATLAESGLPGAATGSVVLKSPGNSNLCTITLPATSCTTSAALAVGSYSPITAKFTPADANFTASSSANSASLTISAATTPPFAVSVNGSASSTVAHGTAVTLAESGLPGVATGSVVFSSPGSPNLCSVTLPATSCVTSATLAVGSYDPITASFTPADGNFTPSSSTIPASLTIFALAPGAPTGAHATASVANITVTWTAPTSNGGAPITGYTVTAAPGAKTMTVPASATHVTFTGVAPGRYTFTVRATNSAGTGAPSSASNAVTIAGVPRSGYWMLGAKGQVYAFGNASHYGDTSSPAVAMAARRDGRGYWVVNAAGNVGHFGAAADHGGKPSLLAGERVTTIAATPSGNGYWLFTDRGRAFPFGDAHFFGDMRAVRLNGPVIASAATPTGRGYYMVGSDGGVFTFGDAKFHGSTGALHLNKPVVGLSPTPDNKGYWLVASDGGVFAFNAPFRGSMGGVKLNKPVNGLVAFGNGYLMVASDGGVFDLSDKPFYGSLGAEPPSAPIIGITAFTIG